MATQYVPRGSHPSPPTKPFAAGQKTVSDPPVMIVPADPRRRGVTILNLDAANEMYIGHDAQVNSSNGMRLKAGESQPIDTGAEVWGYAAAPVQVAWDETRDT